MLKVRVPLPRLHETETVLPTILTYFPTELL
jgi:hypothetical protein